MKQPIRADDLCQYALLAVGGGYCYGASGEVCNPDRREQWAQRNPSQAGNLLGICAKWDGKRVWDCSGLFRGVWRALWNYRSGGATTIWNTWCTGAKGSIATMPDRPGLAVFVQSLASPSTYAHIGLYVGDGMVVDAGGSRTGVLHRKLSAHPWTHWADLDDVDAFNTGTPPEQAPALWSGRVGTRTGGGISLWTDGTKTMAVARVPEGALVDVLGAADAQGFAQTRYGRAEGLCDLRYVYPVDGEAVTPSSYPATVVDVHTGLNLRSSPENTDNTLLLIPPGRTVEVFPERASGPYAYVRYAGKAGYCTAGKLRRASEEAMP